VITPDDLLAASQASCGALEPLLYSPRWDEHAYHPAEMADDWWWQCAPLDEWDGTMRARTVPPAWR